MLLSFFPHSTREREREKGDHIISKSFQAIRRAGAGKHPPRVEMNKSKIQEFFFCRSNGPLHQIRFSAQNAG